MKRVRFESPCSRNRMDELECHSPRPFIEKQISVDAVDFCYRERILPYNPDPIHRFERSNSLPYPIARKTSIPVCGKDYKWTPSNDLDISMLDAAYEAKQHSAYKPSAYKPSTYKPTECDKSVKFIEETNADVLTSIENTKADPHVSSKNSNFFLRRDHFDQYSMHINPLHRQLNKLGLGKENPVTTKADLMTNFKTIKPANEVSECTVQHLLPESYAPHQLVEKNECQCHHCMKVLQKSVPQTLLNNKQSVQHENNCQIANKTKVKHSQCHCRPLPVSCFHCSHNTLCSFKDKTCYYVDSKSPSPPRPLNAVDKKVWAMEKYEQDKNSECLEVEKQANITKEKREPTITDLLKIIKLQNEQLQLLQEKVDRFISTNSNNSQKPVHNYTTEHVALQTINSDSSKISIGVMTSFEMVRTSTVINKEYITQTKNNAQIQCNRSQISIKEVVSKTHPENLNVLDGILPLTKTIVSDAQGVYEYDNNDVISEDATVQQHQHNVIDDKTLNELSLFNLQVDNATTPLISPEQTMYLDVRDYSDSDSSSDDQSHVGWTYYNKVMTHVNGMLEDSDMPSSASALYKNTRQQCLQMQVDKTNLSVTKRVKFGDDPLGLHQPHIYASSTDTSMKMNQLAAKYLKTVPSVPNRTAAKPIEMSFATRNYMAKHNLLQGLPKLADSAVPEMPRFLDITALKRQPKLL